VFLVNSGSEANDTMVKLAWYYNVARGKPAKREIISRKGPFTAAQP
jgi:4-aminobutyrate--pyruvate transaminase